MLELLFLIPLIPLLASLKLMIVGPRLSRNGIAFTGVGSIALSAILAVIVSIRFMMSPPPVNMYSQTLWTWFTIAGFSPGIGLHLDPLSIVMMLVVTIVGFLIHLYSSEFMIEEEGYSRFFAYMNLFIGSMLILVLADNLLFFYVGWEGVGLCSYLLIGFWYKNPANGKAAMKAFIVTRVGDAALAVGLLILFSAFGSLNIQDILHRAPQEWAVGSGIAIAAAALILGGAVGKSAQLPLQVWLPDAMAGPSPVSALIHAATMVTAGVYLIARMHTVFTLAPPVQTAVAVTGAATLLVASFSALTQYDIKRVLAYSTISQIGYMFLALGVGAWSSAIFHFMTHAFFKALLFLAAGAVIMSLDREHDMFKMGGLRKQLPLVFWTFLIGSASLSALPLVTAGFYSKDQILWSTFNSGSSLWLWGAGFLGALLTSLYTFRMVFLTFFGDSKRLVQKRPGIRITIPLVTLAVLSVIGGFVELPETLGDVHIFAGFLTETLPGLNISEGIGLQSTLQTLTGAVSLSGILMAYVFYRTSTQLRGKLIRNPIAEGIRCFLLSGWNFDLLYERLFVSPFIWLARANKNDVIDLLYTGIVQVHRYLNSLLCLTQSGKIRWYAATIVMGVIILLGVVTFL